MRCQICNSRQRLAFIADVDIVGRVEYWRCDGCGFTSSPTYMDMTEAEFAEYNQRAHAYLGSGENPGDKRWKQRMDCQADAIIDLARRGVIDGRRWLDYGCGNGRFADRIGAEKYDPAMGFTTPPQELGYSLVVSTSVFEHLRTRDEMEEAEIPVGVDGVLAIHTLVCECIPDDPKWFYLQPMHCSLFTNAAMQHLFAAWKYAACLYDVPARMWFWTRKEIDTGSLLWTTYHHARGRFIDYWK